jgi:MFS family permease
MVDDGDSYLLDVLPGVTLLGVGLTTLVPTLTATVMASAPQHLAGIASGVNNGVARAAGLLAVAALPAVAGLSGEAYADPDLLTDAYRIAMGVCAALLAGGAVAALTLRPRALTEPPATEPAAEPVGASAPHHSTPAPCTAPGLPPSHGR